VFANLAVCFDRFDQPDVAATIYGASTLLVASQSVLELSGVVDHLRAVLGDTAFDNCAATGAAMDPAEAVAYARHHIELARRQAANPDSRRTSSPPTAPSPALGSGNNGDRRSNPAARGSAKTRPEYEPLSGDQ
jgi:hypothetical protein